MDWRGNGRMLHGNSSGAFRFTEFERAKGIVITIVIASGCSTDSPGNATQQGKSVSVLLRNKLHGGDAASPASP
jgi:hypothetical protein